MVKKKRLRKIAGTVFPKPNRLLKELNSNALMKQFCKSNPTDVIFDHRYDLFEFVQSTVVGDGPVDYLEFGVFKGESIGKWSQINRHADSQFIGFDTFEGLPEVWDGVRGAAPAGQFDTQGQVPEISDERVSFVKGLFQDTLAGFIQTFEPRGAMVVHNDSDLYSSTLYSLTVLDQYLNGGAVVIFDEFYSSSHEFQAFYDYSIAYRKQYTVIGAVGADPYLQVAIKFD